MHSFYCSSVFSITLTVATNRLESEGTVIVTQLRTERCHLLHSWLTCLPTTVTPRSTLEYSVEINKHPV